MKSKYCSMRLLFNISIRLVDINDLNKLDLAFCDDLKSILIYTCLGGCGGCCGFLGSCGCLECGDAGILC